MGKKDKKQKQQATTTSNKQCGNMSDISFDSEGEPEVVRKVNQDLKQNEKGQKKNKESTLTSKVLKKLPNLQIKPKRKSSASGSDCSTPTSQKSNVSQRIQEFIGHFKKAPKFIVDNEYIKHGYRINHNSITKVFKSLFSVHNESVNIWTHVLGAVFVIVLIFYIIINNNVIEISGFKSHLIEDFKHRYDSIYQEFQNFDDSFSEHIKIYQQKIQKNVDSFNHELHEQIQHYNATIHENFHKFLIQFENIKNSTNPEIHKIADNLALLPSIIKSYLHGLDNLNIQDNQTYIKWKDYLKGFQSEYMKSIIAKSVDSTDGFALQDISKWPIFIFLISACLCLSFSATFHLFFVYKEKYYKYFLRLDYAGVSLLISGSTMPVFYYGFYCSPALAIFYLALIGSASLVVFIVSLQDFIHTAKYWVHKSVMYASLGIFAAVPMVHLGIHEAFFSQGDPYTSVPSLVYYLLMGFFYLGGLFIYAYRFPERYKPGHFDICGASHQIWHVSIVAAVVVTYIAAMINFYTRSNSLCPAQ